MKKFVLSILAGGILAGTANAVGLGMEFQNGEGYYATMPSEAVWIDIYVTLMPSESISGLGFRPALPDPVGLVSSMPGPGFTDGSDIPGGWLFFGISGGYIHADEVTKILVGGFDVHFEDGEFSDTYEIFFEHEWLCFFDDHGHEYYWDARYAMTVSYPGYIAYADWGNPGWGTNPAKGHQPTPNPLILHNIPEPTSVALLALGGLAVLRRR